MVRKTFAEQERDVSNLKSQCLERAKSFISSNQKLTENQTKFLESAKELCNFEDWEKEGYRLLLITISELMLDFEDLEDYLLLEGVRQMKMTAGSK